MSGNVLLDRLMAPSLPAARREKAQIPGFLVSHVVHCPRGAAPCACRHFWLPAL